MNTAVAQLAPVFGRAASWSYENFYSGALKEESRSAREGNVRGRGYAFGGVVLAGGS